MAFNGHISTGHVFYISVVVILQACVYILIVLYFTLIIITADVAAAAVAAAASSPQRAPACFFHGFFFSTQANHTHCSSSRSTRQAAAHNILPLEFLMDLFSTRISYNDKNDENNAMQ